MGFNINPVYHLNLATYQQLLESGQGEVIYGNSFPANVSVFKSEQVKYFAVAQAYELVREFSDASGASAEDIVKFIVEFGEAISDVNKDVVAGLITDDDFKDIVNELDGGDE